MFDPLRWKGPSGLGADAGTLSRVEGQRVRELAVPCQFRHRFLPLREAARCWARKWDEIDLDAALWTVPAAHMKAGREHRVSLVPRALAILQTVEKIRTSVFIFPGQRRGKPLLS
jgi:integrase